MNGQIEAFFSSNIVWTRKYCGRKALKTGRGGDIGQRGGYSAHHLQLIVQPSLFRKQSLPTIVDCRS